MNFGGDHSAPGHGKISPRCVPKLPAMARYRPDAFPKGPRTGKAPVRGNISPACIQIQLILARYARHASEKPRRAPLGNAPREHLAAKGRFRRPKPSNHARRTNLAALRWPCPCAGAPARAAASRDRLSTAWPLLRDAHPSASPIPATCQCLPLAVPVAARGKPPMGFGGGHPAHGLQFGRAPRGRRPHHLGVRPIAECCAEPGLDSRTVNKRAQNRRQRPQARPGLRQRCQKRPSKGRVPLGGTIGTPPRKGAFPPTALLAPSLPPIKGAFGKTPIIALGTRAKSTTLRLRRLEPTGKGFLQNGASNPICKRDEIEHGQTRCLLNRRRIRRQVAALKQDGLNIRMLLTQILR